ncbi:hypothetical protein ACFL0Y_02110 [Patescibacteria group bacterium]
MVKKIASLAGAGALLATMAVPAFGMWFGSNDVNIGNWAVVKTKVSTKADSGDNYLGGMMVYGGSIRTGAAGATSLVTNDVNETFVGCNDCDGDVNVGNWAVVKTRVRTKADTGDNYLGGMCVGGGSIVTGAAGALSDVWSVVNYSMVGVDPS